MTRCARLGLNCILAGILLTFLLNTAQSQPAPPAATTLPTSAFSATTATLNGSVNPNSFPTSGFFEWGTTTNYGNATVSQSLGSGAENINFSQTLTGLIAGITYHFRAVASNSFYFIAGTNQSFTTIPDAYFLTGDINLVTGEETYPHVTQDETAIWGHSNVVVVAYNDSRAVTGSPATVGAVSVSTNGGNTFTRLPYLFNEGGSCFGQPSVFYSVRAAKWYVAYLSSRCGPMGAGQWESADGINWINSGCMATGANLDRISTWVDNNPGSPYYGRQYAVFNDFNLNSGAVRLTYSVDDGDSWSLPTTIAFTPFRQALKITGHLGADGTIFVQMLETGTGFNVPRVNWIARSTNGGFSATLIQQGSPFFSPGRSSGTSFGMYTNPVAGYWREGGWGQPGVGPDGVVHYVYSGRTSTNSPDPGDIFYIRSTDNGATWSVPVQLNSDPTERAQWSPSLSVNARGMVFASWYDERHTTDDSLERYGRASFDNGATWQPEVPVSDVIFPKPLQPDPNLISVYAGTYNYAAFSDDGRGDIAYNAWTDGRVSINNTPQQDVFFDKVVFGATVNIESITRNGSGEVLLGGRGVPNSPHSLQVAPDLSGSGFFNFTNVTADLMGRWHLNAGSASSTQGFYRLSYP